MRQPIYDSESMERQVLRLGFLPFFKNPIPGFSIEELTSPEYWFEEGVEGPWEWKGPVIRNWNCAYGKFFGGKAGYVSMEWFPDFANYRRSRYPLDAASLDEEGKNRERLVYETVKAHESLLSKELKRLCDFKPREEDVVSPIERLMERKRRKGKGESIETILTRLQMASRLVVADFEYLLDKHGHPYGWGVARYATPEALYGDGVASSAGRSPEESKVRIVEHFRRIVPQATEAQILRMIG